ncbi:hypothetical protein [Snodgrassella sp. CFCC 13594]|uniref:hypothetical protein n=1 Tax=Snodgrassella sp. CFCC 13594 TaxID=1775559 RepID=UPI000AE28E45|nr:hypothetical protein [Snodgrassella sp. CFCC 13594]
MKLKVNELRTFSSQDEASRFIDLLLANGAGRFNLVCANGQWVVARVEGVAA